MMRGRVRGAACRARGSPACRAGRCGWSTKRAGRDHFDVQTPAGDRAVAAARLQRHGRAVTRFDPARAGRYSIRARTVKGAKQLGLVAAALQSPFRDDRVDRPPLRHPDPPHRGDARRDGAGRGRRRRVRRGPDRRARSRSGWPGCSGTRPRCSPRPGRWPTCSRSARSSRRARRCSASPRAHIARAELGAHGAIAGSRCGRGRIRAGQADLRRDPVAVRARHGAVLRAAPRRSRSRTPTTSPVVRCSRWPSSRTCGSGPPASAPASTSTVPGSGTRTSPPASRSRSTARSPRSSRSACPRGSAPRSAR